MTRAERRELDRTSKRLYVLMQLGVRLYTEDGHRWLETTPCDWYSSFGTLREHMDVAGIRFATDKVYGSAEDALDFVDWILAECGQPSLEESFDRWDMAEHLGLDGYAPEAHRGAAYWEGRISRVPKWPGRPEKPLR